MKTYFQSPLSEQVLSNHSIYTDYSTILSPTSNPPTPTTAVHKKIQHPGASFFHFILFFQYCFVFYSIIHTLLSYLLIFPPYFPSSSIYNIINGCRFFLLAFPWNTFSNICCSIGLCPWKHGSMINQLLVSFLLLPSWKHLEDDSLLPWWLHIMEKAALVVFL